MCDSPGSVVTLLCSGIQLYSAEQRIADCILNDVKWASVVTSAQLARASQSSEATVTRLCHKLGFDNYRKFQLALARDVMDQQETETQRSTSPDPLRQALQSVQANRQEEVRATIQALNLRQLRKAMSVLRSAELIEVEASDNSLPVAMDASLKLGSLGKRCMTSAVPGRTRAFAATLTERDALLLISNSGRSERLLETALNTLLTDRELPRALETARAAHERGASVLLITCDRRSPLAAQADHLLLASNRAQRIVATDPVPSLLSSALLVEVLYYLLLTEEDL